MDVHLVEQKQVYSDTDFTRPVDSRSQGRLRTDSLRQWNSVSHRKEGVMVRKIATTIRALVARQNELIDYPTQYFPAHKAKEFNANKRQLRRLMGFGKKA